MLADLDIVVLTRNLPEEGLARGAVGTVVLVHDRSEAYEIEFDPPPGKSLTVVTLEADAVRLASAQEIAAARRLAHVASK